MTRPDESATCDVRVLLAEDSATIRHYLTSLIDAAPGMCVIGAARDGAEVIEMVAELQPDVISMDVRMPHVDGLEATRRIMAEHPTPVVVVSSLVEREIELSMQALQAGALAVVEKPPDRANPDFADKQRRLLRTLAAMAKVSVVRRGSTSRLPDESTDDVVRVTKTLRPTPEIIAIGASAGGPSALSRLLRDFSADLPVPVVVVQHIPQEFIVGLSRWLDKLVAMPVRVVTDGDILAPGVVHLSPGEAHLKVMRENNQLVGRLHTDRGSYHYYPAVDVLFKSVAMACGSAAVGVILTGMGSDGAEGLMAMYRAGARTFAQDQASSTVFGMPRAAIDAGAVQKTLALPAISTAILKLL